MVVISEMYISLAPTIIAGILNMCWCKTDLCNWLSRPMDRNRILKDGKRMFGENKTWKGFFGMIILSAICTVIWGALCGKSGYLVRHNYLYQNYDNTLIYNIVIGLSLGIAYALAELPNSFMKRRIEISPGKSLDGPKGIWFIFFDQADSVFGCVLVLCFVFRMTIPFYLFYVLLGALTHLLVNAFLYFAKLRKNMF